MTQWGLDNLFNPGKRHMDDEKRRLQSTREEVGDNSGGRRIDLEGGRVSISVPGRARPPADVDEVDETADFDVALAAEDVPAVALASDETEIEPVVVDETAAAPVVDTEPVVGPEPASEPEPVVEPEPVSAVEPEPAAEPVPADEAVPPARRRSLSANAWSRRG